MLVVVCCVFYSKTQLCEESEQSKQTLTEELDKVKFSHNKTQQSLEVLREAYNKYAITNTIKLQKTKSKSVTKIELFRYAAC